jgi:argininosuccinate synthase
MTEKVVLAYSGGLDTSVAVRWIKEKYKMDVITMTGDVGNEKDFTAVKEKAVKVGALKAIVKDLKKEFVESYIWPALQANAIYEGKYNLATALARPLIAKYLVEIAKQEGASAIAHGCTGKGNDQVRFDVSTNALEPDLKIIAPAREWGMTREETINYAEKFGIPVPITVKSPYSLDENLWGRSIECGILEDPWAEPPEEIYAWTKSPEEAPDKPTNVEIEFEKGIPIGLNGKKLDGIALIKQLHEIAGKNGVGRVDHVENRLVGIKSREIYEAPAGTVLLAAHQALEGLTLSKDQIRFKQMVATEYADLIYNGLWFSALREDLAAYVKSTQRYVTGTVRVKLFKGNCTVTGRKSPYSLYNISLATYDKGDKFDQKASPGFIHIWGLPVRTQARVQGIEELKGN